MGKSCIVALMTVFLIGAYSQETIKVTFILKNIYRLPTFQFTQDITVEKGQPFIRVMEAAAKTNRAYEFGAHYYAANGYLVNEMNGVAADYPADRTYWELFKGEKASNDGPSHLILADGDVVMLNFTVGAATTEKPPVAGRL